MSSEHVFSCQGDSELDGNIRCRLLYCNCLIQLRGGSFRYCVPYEALFHYFKVSIFDGGGRFVIISDLACWIPIKHKCSCSSLQIILT